MTTLAEKIAAVQSATAKKIADLEAADKALQHLRPIIDGYRPPFVHPYQLYGATGSFEFKAETYGSLKQDDEKDPDADLMRALLTAFPPLPKVKVKNYAVSFRPDFGESYSTEERPAEEYECAGVTVAIGLFQEQIANVSWFARLPDDTVWTFNVKVSLYRADFGVADIVANRSRDTGAIMSYERCNFLPRHDAQKVTYASGGPEYPKSFVLYWDRDSGSALDFPALAYAKGGAQ